MSWFNSLTGKQQLYIGLSLLALVAVGLAFKVDFTPLLKLFGFGATQG
jgi:hypothetical protein